MTLFPEEKPDLTKKKATERTIRVPHIHKDRPTMCG